MNYVTTTLLHVKVAHSLSISRASRQRYVITSSFDWFTVLSVSFVIGLSDHSGFGFATLN